MFETIRNAWKIKDLRKKILFTLGMLLVYRFAAAIRLPNVNFDAAAKVAEGSLFALMDLFNGGTLKYFTLLATGITPYITSSIIMQLLTLAIPALERLQKEGEEGRKKITKITRYVGIGLALFQSLAIMITNRGILYNNAWYMIGIIGIIHAAGTAFAMWMGESISEKGIGNGISLLIFINIISRLPVDIITGFKSIFVDKTASFWLIPAVIIAVLVVIVAVVYVNIGERRIPIVYSKRISGRKMYGGQSTYIPMRVNSSGVLPLIFAMTFVSLPTMILPYFPEWKFTTFYMQNLGVGTVPYALVTILLIVAFAYFYSSITFNPFEMAENLRKYGGKVRGIREGKPTAVYMQKISSRITLFAALFLAFLAVIPMAVLATTGSSSPLQATSILIMVSVAIETSKQIEAQLISHNHRGFL
ncbi:MAG: preprotein translocase subunit SecY [Clostridia bacterium]|nr:preprotein translocase subunit SecY [Clostridia bacterium]